MTDFDHLWARVLQITWPILRTQHNGNPGVIELVDAINRIAWQARRAAETSLCVRTIGGVRSVDPRRATLPENAVWPLLDGEVDPTLADNLCSQLASSDPKQRRQAQELALSMANDEDSAGRAWKEIAKTGVAYRLYCAKRNLLPRKAHE